jgi:hemolysin activation/secretion protein
MPAHSLNRRVLATLLAGLGTAPLFAATAPTGGDALRQTQLKPAELPRETDPVIIEKKERKPLALPKGATVKVTDVTITGNKAVPSAELTDAVAGLKDREVHLSDLQEAADKITEEYRARGYILARAYVPAQSIENGAVEIAVLEGRYGKVEVANRSAVSDSSVKSQVASLKPGEPVTADNLERDILLLNDRAGANAKASLRPGASVGTSDLLVDVEAVQRVQAELYTDNYGNRYTGQYRAAADVTVNSPLGFGDRLDTAAIFGSQTDGWAARQLYGRLAYRTPVGNEGTSLGTSYSALGYHLGREFSDLDAHGVAQIAGVFVGQNLVRSRALNVAAQLGYEHKRLDDEVDAVDSNSVRELNNLTLVLSADRTDSTGVTLASVGITGGVLDIRDAATAALDKSTVGTEGGFTVFRAGLKRIQRISGPLSLYLSGDAQYADNNLASAEKSGSGGPYGVRAYPQGESSGDASFLSTAELRYDFASNWRVTAFYDGAWIKADHSTFAPGDNERYLGGPGLGLNWAPGTWSFKTEVAVRTDGPAQSEPDHAVRYWLRASKSF